MPHLYVSHEMGRIVLPLELAKLYREIGISGIRYLVQWSHIEPERRKFDWSFMDETTDNAIAAGLTVCCNPYFFPAWVTGGFDCMSSYDCACAKGAVSLPDSGESAKCYSEYVVDDTACFDLGVALAKRYGDRVSSWGVFNEPGVRLYWLTTRTQLIAEDGAKDAIEKWYDIVAYSFMAGLSFGAVPLAAGKFVSQFDQFCDYEHCLSLESGPTKFDEIGIHPYNDVHATPDSTHTMTDYHEVTHEVTGVYDLDLTTAAVLAKGDEMKGRMAQYLSGRPVAISEIMHCDNAVLMRAGYDVTEHNPMRYVTMHKEWSPNGPVLVPGLPGGKRTFELTEEGRELQAALKAPSRRRAVIK